MPLPRQIPLDAPSVHRFPAGSFFGGFRTPALDRVDRSCSGRHLKPFPKAVLASSDAQVSGSSETLAV